MHKDEDAGQNAQRLSQLRAFLPFSSLDYATLSELAAHMVVQRFDKDQGVTAAGETSKQICFIRTGILRVQKNLHDGRQHVVALLVAGDMFGRLFDGPMPFVIEAATDAEIIAFPREPFESLVLQYPDLERLVLLEFLTELDRARDWMLVLGNTKMRGRVAGFLVVLHTRFQRLEGLIEKHDGRTFIRLPIGRKDIARLLGTRTESISRALHALAADGVVDIVRPDLLAIPDCDALIQEAGDIVSSNLAGFDPLVEGRRSPE
ncbi:MAG: Crp/Fnr family transcriptional regulator [Paracoccus sp. (in: a-proteobacteria)]